jgi:hypothetical protein
MPGPCPRLPRARKRSTSVCGSRGGGIAAGAHGVSGVSGGLPAFMVRVPSFVCSIFTLGRYAASQGGLVQDARKSFQRMRHDLLLQIDSSVSGRGLVTTCGTTAYHKFPRHQIERGGFSPSGTSSDPACKPFVEIDHVAFPNQATT